MNNISAWTHANQTYPFIAFNDNAHKRNKDHVLFAVEGYNIVPSNYDMSVITQYGGYITTNSKMYDIVKPIMGDRCWLMNGCVRWDDVNTSFAEFIPTSDKIDGVCLMQRHRINNAIGDIVQLRSSVMLEIHQAGMLSDCYGKVPYNGNLYKGPVGGDIYQQSPSTVDKLAKLNQYRFSLCFENVYHPMWSYDMLTEKIVDCFRAKTIPIYYGCYNIEQVIPPELFIDFRRFANKPRAMLVDYLRTINDQQYQDTVDRAHRFVQEFTDYGTVQAFTKLVETHIK